MAGNPITIRAFDHWMYVAEKGNAEEDGGPVIVPTDPPQFNGCIKQVREQIATYAKTPAATLRKDCKELFTQLSSQVMDFLIKAYWYQATAYKDGITITKAELAKAFAAAKKQSFPTTAEYKEFLAETGETIDFRLRVNTIYQKLLNKHIPKLTPAVIDKYYKAHATQFGTPQSRDILLIQTTSKSKIEAAEAALKSGESFATVAKQYSTNTASKDDGGVVKNVENGQEEAAVNKVIFAAGVGKLKGPIKGTFGYYLVKVTKIVPATKVSLAKATPEIKELLNGEYDTKAEDAVNAAAKKAWQKSTKCAAVYSMADCAGYKAPVTTTATTTAPATATASESTATVSSTQTATTASTGTTG